MRKNHSPKVVILSEAKNLSVARAQLKIRQPAIAKLERRADMYLSTLRNVIRAMEASSTFARSSPTGQFGSKG